MADSRISQLDAQNDLKDDDKFVIVEDATGLNKSVTASELADYAEDELGIATINGTISALTASLNAKANTTALTAHTTDTDNPHMVTKEQVGLSSADNTSDANKPISTATQAALDAIPVVGANPGGTGTDLTTVSIDGVVYEIPEPAAAGLNVVNVSVGNHTILNGEMAWVSATEQYINQTGVTHLAVSAASTFGTGWLKLGDGQAMAGSGITEADGDARYLQIGNNLNDIDNVGETLVNLGITVGSGSIITDDERNKLTGIEESADVNVVNTVTVGDGTTQSFDPDTGALILSSTVSNLEVGTTAGTALEGNTPLLQVGTAAGTALEGNTPLLQLGDTDSTALAGNTEVDTVDITGLAGEDISSGDEFIFYDLSTGENKKVSLGELQALDGWEDALTKADVDGLIGADTSALNLFYNQAGGWSEVVTEVTKASVDTAIGAETADTTLFYNQSGVWSSPGSDVTTSDLENLQNVVITDISTIDEDNDKMLIFDSTDNTWKRVTFTQLQEVLGGDPIVDTGLTGISIDNLTFTGTGEVANLVISGDVGTQFNLAVVNTTPMGWLTSGALGATSGTIPADGTFETTITIPAASMTLSRTAAITATNSMDVTDSVTTGLFTQTHTVPSSDGDLVVSADSTTVGSTVTFSVNITAGDPNFTATLFDGDPDGSGTQVEQMTSTALGTITFTGIDTSGLAVATYTYFIRVSDSDGDIVTEMESFTIAAPITMGDFFMYDTYYRDSSVFDGVGGWLTLEEDIADDVLNFVGYDTDGNQLGESLITAGVVAYGLVAVSVPGIAQPSRDGLESRMDVVDVSVSPNQVIATNTFTFHDEWLTFDTLDPGFFIQFGPSPLLLCPFNGEFEDSTLDGASWRCLWELGTFTDIASLTNEIVGGSDGTSQVANSIRVVGTGYPASWTTGTTVSFAAEFSKGGVVVNGPVITTVII